MLIGKIEFPTYTGLRCLMMPYIQGDSNSVPKEYHTYKEIINSLFFKKGDIGYLTIDESSVQKGQPHRGQRAKFDRAIHTEAGIKYGMYGWGGVGWGSAHKVTLDEDVEVILSNNLDNSCAIWNKTHYDTSEDGDIGYVADQYPYEDAYLMKAGDVCKIGILTPHESLPVKTNYNRQFLRLVSAGVHGREEYFTENPLFK